MGFTCMKARSNRLRKAISLSVKSGSLESSGLGGKK